MQDKPPHPEDPARQTLPHAQLGGQEPGRFRRFRLTVVEGTMVGATWESSADRGSVGSHPRNDFVLDEPTISRFHCELQAGPEGVTVRDMSSLNGVIVDGVRVKEAILRGGSLLHLGALVVRFDFSPESNQLRISEQTRFGTLVGTSVAMRAAFYLLEKAAASDATVLLEGETGTGKSQAAQALHEASPRKDRPFLVVDCTALPSQLLESELFGHERGAFTGAVSRRVGAFEEAAGGTIFLDEVGELPAELQPKLLHVLQDRQVRRVGSNVWQKVNVRIIAATHRNLRWLVNTGGFRADLFYRLAVVRIVMPGLRQRLEDLREVALAVLASLGASEEQRHALLSPEVLTRLQQWAWPGNVRELRNYLERCMVFEEAPSPSGDTNWSPSATGFPVDLSVPFTEARRQALMDFEHRYLSLLMETHQGHQTQAATAARMDRVYLYRLLRRHGIKR
ncbi:sigma 54-interacting transcriptional regulator [Hyalangium minutum]|uniref:Sigma-54 dependent transcriptional regulator, Fis family protein n=1 Tax=Hyalangium minutum TaxID=394096 RepID=A0A085W3V3_9BACT|nr:sigma 54-interacting transcriptional regulator [Hyalangium minutum]KFE62366.1 Sigma-54 dependent transcriptional regulator, Fis family protein [Hyalangium minutum]